jgi:drug/metabolite transporter (DMT)-like permease
MPVGELAALGAAALWAVSTILWTRQMAVSPPLAMNLFKLGLCLPFFVVVLFLQGGRTPLAGVDGASLAALVLSGVIGMTLGDTAYFAALSRIGAQRTMLLQCLSPVFAAGLSVLAGQDLPGRIGAAGVALVLVGLALVLRERPVGTVAPGHAVAGVFLGLAAAFGQGLGIVLTKRGLTTSGIGQASAVRMASAVAGLLLLELVRGRLAATLRHVLHPPALARIVPAALMGSLLGFYLFQASILHAEPAVAAALAATSPIFVAPLSVVFLGERMRAGAWVGTIVAVAGVALVMLG